MSNSVMLALLIGAPVLALALAVAYHAQLYLLDRRGQLTPGEPAAAPDAPPELVLDLRRSIEELQDQLSRQRQSLHGLMSERAQRDARRGLGEPAAPAAAPSPVPAPTLAASPEPDDSLGLRTSVQRLAAEGLSDRAIARRMRIGLEEVRLLSKRRSPPRPEPVA